MECLCMGCMELLAEDKEICQLCGYKAGTLPLEASHILPGTVLAERYIIGRVLGFGSFGVTYLSYDTVLKKKVAIKEYFPGEFSTRVPKQVRLTIYSGDKEEQFAAGKAQFIDEARRLAKVQNVPEVVRVYDCFEENQTAYIVMEYLEGETLNHKLEREGTMSVEQALPIIFDVLHALRAVHAVDILHRDIAPDNIFITKDNKIKVMDFGSARFATTTHSRSITVLIKSGYSPEEQYRSNGDQGTWTDVYATAAMFYKMLTGVTPEDALERAAKDTVKAPSKLGVKIGPNTEIALLNAMNVKIEDRTQTAKQFEDELLANVVNRIVGKKNQVDIGQWPLWLKVISVVGVAGIITFFALFATGIIHFDVNSWSTNSVPTGKTRVPNVVNIEMEAAIERGKTANLNVQVSDKQYSAEIPENRVLSQSIKGGTVVDDNETLEIVISAGIEKTYVPNVVGMESETAIQLLKDSGFVVSASEKEYRAAPGTIGWQSLDAAVETDTGTTIEIIISQGIKGGDPSKSEVVEELNGMDFAAAADKMVEKYLYLVNIGNEHSDTIPAGAIIRQEPEAGALLKQNSNIRVAVSLGRELINVPDVQYKIQEEAVAMLEAVGLIPDIRQETSQTVAEGNVIRQDIEAGERVEKGSNIAIYISAGVPVQQQNNNSNNNAGNTPRDNANSNVGVNNSIPPPQDTQQTQPQVAETQATQPREAAAASSDPIWGVIGD